MYRVLLYYVPDAVGAGVAVEDDLLIVAVCFPAVIVIVDALLVFVVEVRVHLHHLSMDVVEILLIAADGGGIVVTIGFFGHLVAVSHLGEPCRSHVLGHHALHERIILLVDCKAVCLIACEVDVVHLADSLVACQAVERLVGCGQIIAHGKNSIADVFAAALQLIDSVSYVLHEIADEILVELQHLLVSAADLDVGVLHEILLSLGEGAD